MVRRFFARIAAPVRGVHQAAYILAALTLASQVLALLRDRTFAHTFGAGPILDLYYAAFRIPDFLFASIGSLVSASILLPYFIERFEESKEAGHDFSDAMFTVFFGAIAIVAG